MYVVPFSQQAKARSITLISNRILYEGEKRVCVVGRAVNTDEYKQEGGVRANTERLSSSQTFGAMQKLVVRKDADEAAAFIPTFAHI